MSDAGSSGRTCEAGAEEARLSGDLLVRKGRAGPVSRSLGHATLPPAETPPTTDAIMEPRSARAGPTSGHGSSDRPQACSTSSQELAKLTVRIPQVRHQALRLAAARRGVSIQVLIGDMIDVLARTELRKHPHCACLQAALELNGKACDRE